MTAGSNMATLLFLEKKPPSATRKCPWIRRVGFFYIDFDNFDFGFRQISLLEAQFLGHPLEYPI